MARPRWWKRVLVLLLAIHPLRSTAEPQDKVPPDASCIPRVLIPPAGTTNTYFRDVQGWVVVKLDGKEGWAKRRYLADQPAEECLPRP